MGATTKLGLTWNYEVYSVRKERQKFQTSYALVSELRVSKRKSDEWQMNEPATLKRLSRVVSVALLLAIPA